MKCPATRSPATRSPGTRSPGTRSPATGYLAGACALVCDRSGVAALEFALIGVLALSLFLGATQFSMLVWMRQAIEVSAADGARCMAVLGTSCTSGKAYSASATTSYIQSIGKGWAVTIPSAAITLTPDGSCGGVTGFSTVTIDYDVTAMPGLMTYFNGGAIMSISACFPNASGS